MRDANRQGLSLLVAVVALDGMAREVLDADEHRAR
jgi:hypothetical protein